MFSDTEMTEVELKEKVGELEQELVGKELTTNWLVTQNGELQRELYEWRKLHSKRTEVFLLAFHGLKMSSKIVEQLRERIGQLEAEKNAEENLRKDETQRRLKLEEAIKKIFQISLSLPPPNVLEQLVVKIHRAFAAIQENQGADGTDWQYPQFRNLVRPADPALLPTQMSSVHATETVSSSPNALEQLMTNAHSTSSSTQPIPNYQGECVQELEVRNAVGQAHDSAYSSFQVSPFHLLMSVPPPTYIMETLMANQNLFANRTTYEDQSSPSIGNKYQEYAPPSDFLEQLMANNLQNLSLVQRIPEYQRSTEHVFQDQHICDTVGPDQLMANTHQNVSLTQQIPEDQTSTELDIEDQQNHTLAGTEQHDEHAPSTSGAPVFNLYDLEEFPYL